MTKHRIFRFTVMLAALLLSACNSTAPVTQPTAADWVNQCTDWDDWDKAGPAFRIYGNSYYVGTCGISAILITSDNGHILIDGATEAGADVIAENIRALDFAVTDIKLLLQSHEHFDHVAGLAKLQQLSGATLLASPEAARVLTTGTFSSSDPQAGMLKAFPAAKVGGLVSAGNAVELGELSLLPIATPGHTAGALSWQWRSCDGGQCQVLVYADSLSPISNDSYRFSDHLSYLNAYRSGLVKLAQLDCQILLTPHPSASNMRAKLQSGKGLSDPQGCKNYAGAITQRLEQRLTKEKQHN